MNARTYSSVVKALLNIRATGMTVMRNVTIQMVVESL